MVQRREPWLKYPTHPSKGESQLGPWGALLWATVLRKAYAQDGVITWAAGRTPDAGLAIAVSACGVADRRLVSIGLAELVQVGLVVIEGNQLTVSGWKSRRPRKPGAERAGESEWLRLPIDESKALGHCSLAARGLAACLLRAGLPDGRITKSVRRLFVDLHWGDRSHDHLWREGNLERWIAELIAAGYLAEATGDEYEIVNFDRYVGLERPAVTGAPPLRVVPTPARQVPAKCPPGAREVSATCLSDARQICVNQAESLTSPSHDLIRSDQIGSPLTAPPKTGGLFPPENPSENSETGPPPGIPERRAGASRMRRRVRSPDGGVYPPWFEAMWTLFPGRAGVKGPKPEALAVAIGLARELGSPELLRDHVQTALEWQCRLAEWRRPDPPIPDFVRYLTKRRWEDERPQNPAAFGDPAAVTEANLPAWKRAELERAEREQANLADRNRARQIAEMRKADALSLEMAEHQAEALLEGWRRNERLADTLPASATETSGTRAFWRGFAQQAYAEMFTAGLRAVDELPLWLRQWRAANPPTAVQTPGPAAVGAPAPAAAERAIKRS